MCELPIDLFSIRILFDSISIRKNLPIEYVRHRLLKLISYRQLKQLTALNSIGDTFYELIIMYLISFAITISNPDTTLSLVGATNRGPNAWERCQ